MYTLYNKNVKLLTGDENYFTGAFVLKLKVIHLYITQCTLGHIRNPISSNAYRYLSKVYDINPREKPLGQKLPQTMRTIARKEVHNTGVKLRVSLLPCT